MDLGKISSESPTRLAHGSCTPRFPSSTALGSASMVFRPSRNPRKSHRATPGAHARGGSPPGSSRKTGSFGRDRHIRGLREGRCLAFLWRRRPPLMRRNAGLPSRQQERTIIRSPRAETGSPAASSSGEVCRTSRAGVKDLGSSRAGSSYSSGSPQRPISPEGELLMKGAGALRPLRRGPRPLLRPR